MYTPPPPTYQSIRQEPSKNMIILFVLSMEYQMGYKYLVKLFHCLTGVDLEN